MREYFAEAFPERQFVPGETSVPCAGRVFDAEELLHAVNASLDFWLTSGRFAEQFEREFARTLGVRHAVLCNSGSSANLLAVSALTSPKLGERRLQPGDEVVTVAAGFPTTASPIVQNRLVPVFVDVELGTYDADMHQVEEAIGPRTKAIILAHTLGNPFDLDRALALTHEHNLWLVEDCCDALGSTYKSRPVGTFGDLASVSFYPAHHVTMGEGGCVVTNQPLLKTLVESFRDWGRDCWCDPGEDNTCGRRFAFQLGQLPYGYDHKYTYSHVGYNMKVTDLQAAVGVAQLRKLPWFIQARKRNWQLLRDRLAPLEHLLLLPQPTAGSDPSWFGFAITVRPEAPFTRDELTRHLEERKIGTRLLFGGNLTRQPAYQDVPYRVASSLKNADRVMHQTFWVGVYPGLTPEKIDYVADSIHAFARTRTTALSRPGE